MKRALASALILSALSGFGLVGCGEESKEKSTTTTEGPGGSTTVTSENKVKTTGDNPPAPAGGTATPEAK